MELDTEKGPRETRCRRSNWRSREIHDVGHGKIFFIWGSTVRFLGHRTQTVQFSSVAQSCLTLCDPMIAACQASLSITNSPGADCGSDYELLIAKFRLKLKRVGKTTRPLRYDLNQIPYEYTVEVRNRFKGLDLIDREPDELWTEVCDIV